MVTTTAVQEDEALGSYDYRVIQDDEKPLVKFNDGDFAFTIRFTSLEEREEGKGKLYSVAMFRTMTDLTADEFKAQYPVVFDKFWHSELKGALGVTEKILREDWEAKLKGDVIYNNGERFVKVMLCNDGNEGLDHLLRKDTNLSCDEFLQTYPVTLDMKWPEDAADKFFVEVEKMEAAWEAGRQRVIELTKQQGLVEKKCDCGDCNNFGYTLEDESNEEAVSQSLYELHNVLHAAGFHRNAAEAYHAGKNQTMFTPIAEETDLESVQSASPLAQ